MDDREIRRRIHRAPGVIGHAEATDAALCAKYCEVVASGTRRTRTWERQHKLSWRGGHAAGSDADREGQERLGFLGDNRMTALSDAMTVYSINRAAGSVLRPTWYRDRFVEWAEEIAGMSVMPDVTNHTSIIWSNWCGRSGCPYPYVTQHIFAPTAEYPGRRIVKENPAPEFVYERMMYPRWGAGLRDANVGQVEMEEEREMDYEDFADYSPVSVENE